MPVLDGRAFLRSCRTAPTLGSRAPVIVCAAGYWAEVEAAAPGADGFLPKPFDLEDLLNIVRRFASPDARS